MRNAAALILLLCAGCGREVALSGSLEEVFPLTVSRVEILRNAEAMQVSYYNNRGVDLDLVARVTVALEGVELQNGKPVSLEGETPSGVARCAVLHLAAGDPPRTLPPIKNGDLTLSSGAKDGESVRGSFAVSFQDTGGFGSGRTLNGNFSGVAADAGFNDF